MSTYSRHQTLRFIEMYRSFECLWRVKSKHYNNRHLKGLAYDELVAFLKRFEPEANKDSVCKKINNLRGCFRKEVRKVEISKLHCSTEEEIYVPKLWYYDALLFLEDQESSPSTSSSIVKVENQTEDTIIDSQAPGAFEDTTFQEDLDLDLDMSPGVDSAEPASPLWNDQEGSQGATPGSSTNLTTVPHPLSTSDEPVSSTVRKRKKLALEDAEQPRSVGMGDRSRCITLDATDNFDIFGQHVSHSLRQMSPAQCIHAQKLISEVLYEGQFGNLSRRSAVLARPTEQD